MALSVAILMILLFAVIIALPFFGIGSISVLIAIGVIGFMFILFGPTVSKIWDFTLNPGYDFGSPLVVAGVVVIVLIFLLRRR